MQDSQRPEAQPESDDDKIQTLLNDVKTIKSILEASDAPLPKPWKALFIGSGFLGLTGILQYVVPLFRNWSFDQKAIFLWLPTITLIFAIAVPLISIEIRKTGKRFLGSFRVREFLISRLVIAPAMLTILYLLSRSEQFALNGVILLMTAVASTFSVLIVPRTFRVTPFIALILGLLEICFDLRAPEVTLFNVLFIASALVFAGLLLRQKEKDHA